MTARPRIAVLTTMRDEGPFVVDWIAHLCAIGVSDILVWSNDCSDGTDDLLDVLQDAGVLRHIRQKGGGKSVQWRALRSAKSLAGYKAFDWIMCIDCDEYVVLKPPHSTLHDLIASSDADAIVLPWRLFGSSGHMRFDERPVTERFLMAAPERVLFPAAARFFKTLWKRTAFARPGVHRPSPKPTRTARWVDGSGTALPGAFAGDDALIAWPDAQVPCGRVQLNHYSLRSAEDFLVKRARGLPNRASKPLDASYWAERNFNTVEDRSAFRGSDATRAERTRLIALPGVAQAHGAAVSRYRARIEECLSDPGEAHLFTRLALLTGSTLPDDKMALELLRLVHGAGSAR